MVHLVNVTLLNTELNPVNPVANPKPWVDDPLNDGNFLIIGGGSILVIEAADRNEELGKVVLFENEV